MLANLPSSKIKPQNPSLWTRQRLLKACVRVLLRMTPSPDDYIDHFIKHGVGRQLIKEVTLKAIDRASEEICGTLTLEIDWKKYEAIVRVQGEGLEKAAASLEEFSVAIQVTELAGLLAEYARYFELKLDWHTRYAGGVNKLDAARLLGLSDAKPRKWKTGPARRGVIRPGDLPELTVDVRLLEDPTGYETPDSWKTILSRIPKLELPRN